MNQRSTAHALDQFFDALAHDPQAVAPPALDAATAHFAQLAAGAARMVADTPAPAPETQARIWQRVLADSQLAEPSGARASVRLSALRRRLVPGAGRKLRWSRGLAAGLVLSLGLVLLGLALGLPGATRPAAAAELLQKAQAATSFVPPGKARHIITSHTFTNVGGQAGNTPGWTDEVWVMNGPTHLLLWKHSPLPLPGQPLPAYLPDTTVLVDETVVWEARPAEQRVYKWPYSPARIAAEVPSQAVIAALLQEPGTRITGTTTLDGRAVLIIAGRVGTIVSGSPLEIAEGRVPGYRTFEHEYQLWVDSQTYQIVQEQHAIRATGATDAPPVSVTTSRIIQDEMVDAAAVPADRFRFQVPAGMTLVDVAAQPPPANPPPAHDDWYTYSSTAGGFSVLMPRTPDAQDYSSGLHMLGARRDGVAYVVTYIDYPTAVIAKSGAEAWLDSERDYVIVRSQGTLRRSQPLRLDRYPGREVTSTDPDGRLRYTRLYLVNNRLYTVYAVTPPDTAPVEVEPFLQSFRLLTP